MSEDRPPIDPYPLSDYVAWAGRRNREPILNAFKTFFPKSGNVLELASGSGAHLRLGLAILLGWTADRHFAS